MYFLPRRLTYCSQILSNCNVPVVASSTGDPAGFLLSVSSSRRLSECLRPTTQKGEKTLLVRPRTTYWASRTSSERVDQAPGKPAEPDNIIIRGRSAEKQAIPCEVGPDNHWEDKLELVWEGDTQQAALCRCTSEIASITPGLPIQFLTKKYSKQFITTLQNFFTWHVCRVAQLTAQRRFSNLIVFA